MCKTRCEYIPVRLPPAIHGFRQSYTCLPNLLKDALINGVMIKLPENLAKNYR